MDFYQILFLLFKQFHQKKVWKKLGEINTQNKNKPVTTWRLERFAVIFFPTPSTDLNWCTTPAVGNNIHFGVMPKLRIANWVYIVGLYTTDNFLVCCLKIQIYFAYISETVVWFTWVKVAPDGSGSNTELVGVRPFALGVELPWPSHSLEIDFFVFTTRSCQKWNEYT